MHLVYQEIFGHCRNKWCKSSYYTTLFLLLYSTTTIYSISSSSLHPFFFASSSILFYLLVSSSSCVMSSTSSGTPVHNNACPSSIVIPIQDIIHHLITHIHTHKVNYTRGHRNVTSMEAGGVPCLCYRFGDGVYVISGVTQRKAPEKNL